MTTVMIDDELGKKARQAAAAQGKSLDQFVNETLQVAIDQPAARLEFRNGLPVVHVPFAKPIDPLVVRNLIEEEGF
jgi:hypothetical protein